MHFDLALVCFSALIFFRLFPLGARRKNRFVSCALIWLFNQWMAVAMKDNSTYRPINHSTLYWRSGNYGFFPPSFALLSAPDWALLILICYVRGALLACGGNRNSCEYACTLLYRFSTVQMIYDPRYVYFEPNTYLFLWPRVRFARIIPFGWPKVYNFDELISPLQVNSKMKRIENY